MKYLNFMMSVILFISCSKEPQPIIYNQDSCTRCKMIISDQRYGAEIITSKGKNYKYDSIECMTAALQTQETAVDVHSIWVIDFNNPEHFINAREAWYLHSSLLKSPMGLNFSAFSNQEMAQTVENVYPGEVIQWPEVKKIVKREWLEN